MPPPPSTSPTAPSSSILIPANLVAPLPILNTWCLAFLIFTLLVVLPSLILSSYLIHRWRTDWRNRPERLTGDRAWEVEAFGCEGCGREPTMGSVKGKDQGLGISFDNGKAKKGEGKEEGKEGEVFIVGCEEDIPPTCEEGKRTSIDTLGYGAGCRDSKLSENADGLEDFEEVILSFEPTASSLTALPEPTTLPPPVLPTTAQKTALRSTRSASSQLLPLHQMSTPASSPSLADPLECRVLSFTGLGTAGVRLEGKKSEWRRSWVGLPDGGGVGVGDGVMEREGEVGGEKHVSWGGIGVAC